MTISFHKYQGTGNDFILIDDRNETFNTGDYLLIERLCDRRFGIGADGLILLRNKNGYDFEMVYFNSDGKPSTMCGNGGRCIAAFGKSLGIGADEVRFLAADGPHKANFQKEKISLEMKNVSAIETRENGFVMNTGSPHFVQITDRVSSLDIIPRAKAIRYNDEFRAAGINVNFVEIVSGDQILVRTYERGVEDETYSCGTGVVASAIAYHFQNAQKKEGRNEISIETKGGSLAVSFTCQLGNYTDVRLIGPATKVFEGEI